MVSDHVGGVMVSRLAVRVSAWLAVSTTSSRGGDLSAARGGDGQRVGLAALDGQQGRPAARGPAYMFHGVKHRTNTSSARQCGGGAASMTRGPF